MLQKQRVTIWPDGQINVVQYGTVDPVLALEDMGDERYAHAALASTVSIEEINRTLTITKDTGAVHVYTWFQ